MGYFYDTYALIELFRGNPKYKKFCGYKIHTSMMNFYEFYYSVLKEFNEHEALYWANQMNLTFIDVGKVDVMKASKFRLKNIKKKLSYIDCLGYVLAVNNNMKFLTGDKEFKGVRGIEFVKK